MPISLEVSDRTGSKTVCVTIKPPTNEVAFGPDLIQLRQHLTLDDAKQFAQEFANKCAEAFHEMPEFMLADDYVTNFLKDKIVKEAIEARSRVYGEIVKEQPYSPYAEDMWHLARAWCILNRKESQ